MRAFVLSLILYIGVFAIGQAAVASVSWNGAHTLFMSKESPTIDPGLADLILSLTSDDATPILVFFTDKGVTSQESYRETLMAAEAALTPAARERRLKARGIDNLVDFRDIPVYAPFVDEVLAIGPSLRQVLKWFNAISVKATPEQIRKLAELPYVRLLKGVAGSRVDFDVPISPIMPPLELTTLNYGPSAGQLNQINVVPAHELGFKGQGVIICMADVGFKQAHQAFQNIINSGRLLAQYDFINHDNNTDYDPNQDSPGQADHGTLTWSTLGGEASAHLYGPSFMASFILSKSEDISSERHIEEDNWAAGAQWADSIGASVISSSLGYRIFDPGQGDYSYSDLDGNTTIVTIAADMAAYNGIAVCNAMGNEGNTDGSLIAPADADSILSCGAVDNSGYLAGFSSWGPTYDGRTKPEVCAQGQGTVCADPYNMTGYTTASGTSLSTPLVGGSCGILFSAHPNWSNMMVREALMMTADRADSAGNAYGWGIMDVGRALYYHPAGDIIFTFRPMISAELNQPIALNINITGGAAISTAQLFWRNGDTGDFTLVTMTTSNGSDFTAEIPGQSGSLVQFYFKATDANTVYAYYPVGGDSHPFRIGLGLTQFTDSFEDGPQYWKSGGTNNFWGLTAKYSRTGNLSITDSPTGNYRDNTDSWLETAFPLDFSHVSAASFSLYWRGVLQTGHDTLFVEGSTDGGSSWQRAPQYITGSGFSFAQYTMDLTPFIGQSDVRLRLRLITDSSGRREGIYIDDVTLAWTPTGIDDKPITIPRVFGLSQNYPNPFNPSTTIAFFLTDRGEVELTIFDLLGRKVKTLLSTELAGGQYSAIWDGTDESGSDVASGIYLYRLSSGSSVEVHRMALLK